MWQAYYEFFVNLQLRFLWLAYAMKTIIINKLLQCNKGLRGPNRPQELPF